MVPEQFRDAAHGQPNLLEFGGLFSGGRFIGIRPERAMKPVLNFAKRS
jgi:hypothetical protein